MSDPRIFDYRDYREWLRDWFVARDGRPSIRGFARRAKCSASLVSAIINGRRDLHTGRAELWARLMDLSDDEQAFLLNLVTAEHDPSREIRESAEGMIEGARALDRSAVLNDATVALFANWYVGAVLELARCRGWRDEPEWIARRIHPAISSDEAARALEILETLNYLVHDEQGVLRPADEIYRTGHDVADQRLVQDALRGLHLDVLKLAARALQETPAALRQFGTTTFAVPESLLPELKVRVARFQEGVLKLVSDARAERSHVYHLGVQLFPLSAPPDPDRP